MEMAKLIKIRLGNDSGCLSFTKRQSNCPLEGFMSFLMDHNLCAVDFSESSIRALETARDFTVEFRSNLIVLYSYRLRPDSPGGEVRVRRATIEENARRWFAEVELKFLAGSPVSYDFTTNVGFLSDGVGSLGKLKSIRMLVVGQQLAYDVCSEEDGFHDFMDKVRIPVLIVP
jgi:hypothetical protein